MASLYLIHPDGTVSQAMTDFNPSTRLDPDPDAILLIVVGSCLRAELSDRMLGYRLRERILGWQDEIPCDPPLLPVVCTDLWYLNADELRDRPILTIGDPETNAATAYLAGKLPTAFIIDETLRVQLDPDFVDLRGCIWGINPTTTISAVDLFLERYLDGYLRSAHDLPVGGYS